RLVARGDEQHVTVLALDEDLVELAAPQLGGGAVAEREDRGRHRADPVLVEVGRQLGGHHEAVGRDDRARLDVCGGTAQVDERLVEHLISHEGSPSSFVRGWEQSRGAAQPYLRTRSQTSVVKCGWCRRGS